ncbi:MAG: glycosyltransferase family 2 protein [Microscillaceae bacterium]|jgi:hypothetical protein|nr:glycosyltransferase family 2 protein [Microscillaceae bacterium]
MKVSGFTFIRNALKYDFPIVEAITSILPICDEFVVAVGNSEDDTLQLIKDINSPKIRIIETVWDDSLREGGRVLALETNKALAEVAQDSDWAFYIQGDEVVHEKDLPAIRAAMELWQNDQQVEGLLFKYLHFYGSYNYVGDSRQWYRREIRIVRPHTGVFSYRDAQGFRKKPDNKLKVKAIDAHIYHYGWVREPYTQMQKQRSFFKLWRPFDPPHNIQVFDYSTIDSLTIFKDTHPTVMQNRIAQMNWSFDYDVRHKKYSLKVRFLTWVEKLTGWRIGEYKNFKLIS